MTVGDRLTELKKSKIFSVKELSTLFNCSESAISFYLNNKRGLSDEQYVKLSNKFGINLHWLITGNGSAFTNNLQYVKSKEKKYDIYNPKTKELIEQNGNKGDYFEVPVVGLIAAGEPILGEHYKPQYDIPVLKSFISREDNCLCFKVNGNSMSPTIEHGEYVVLLKEYSATHLDNKIIAVQTDEGLTLKRLEIDHINKTSILKPINKDHKPIPINDKTHIIGSLKLIIRLRVYPD